MKSSAWFAGLTVLFLSTTVDAGDLPRFADVEAVVVEALRQNKDYQADDLLTRGQVQVALDGVERIGWKLADRGAFENRTVGDDSFLAQKLRTSSGKQFMRKVAGLPLAYDRLDRMAQLPQGRSTVERLARGPDGYKLFDYMANNKGGRELAKMLSKDGRGDFNQPTGKVYTQAQLVLELRTLYDEAARALQAAKR